MPNINIYLGKWLMRRKGTSPFIRTKLNHLSLRTLSTKFHCYTVPDQGLGHTIMKLASYSARSRLKLGHIHVPLWMPNTNTFGQVVNEKKRNQPLY